MRKTLQVTQPPEVPLTTTTAQNKSNPTVFNLIDHFIKIKKEKVHETTKNNFSLDKIAGQ